MREIKFRAWDRKEKELVGDPQATEILLNWKIGRYKVSKHYNDKDFVFMQYTGLKDCNGVEIYEGDIMQHPEFDEGDTFVVIWDNYYGCCSGHGLYKEWISCEIIGNIYESW